MREKISACITAGNEEANIRRCLDSLKWADEIVVVDSYSKDQTAAICREYTPRVYQHPWLGYIGQKNLIKDMASFEWVLFIDADEEVSPALRDEIQALFNQGDSISYAGYEFPRMVFYLGRWIRHGDWYPDIKLRLLRKNRCHCGGKEPHDRMVVDGPVRQLRAPLYHYTYNDISDQLVTLDKFSTITAHTQLEDGRRCGLTDLLFRPTFRFFRGYFLKRGFLDGLAGFIIARTVAYGVFAKYAKLWELQRGVSPTNVALAKYQAQRAGTTPTPTSPDSSTTA